MLWKSQSGIFWRNGALSVSNRTTLARFGAYLALIRPPNTIMIGLGVVIGEAIGIGVLPGIREAVFGFLTASLMMAGTMVANDVYDVEIDRVNSPQRPLPSGTVKTRDAAALAVALSAGPVVRGPRSRAFAVAVLFVPGVLFSFPPPFLESISWLYFPPVILADVGFLYSAYKLVGNQSPENVRAVKGHVLVWMLLGLVGFLLGGAALF